MSDSSLPSESAGKISRTAQFLIVFGSAVLLAAAVSHAAASLFGLQTGKPTYRRVGPPDGPQVYCAGSSLLQFGLSWPEVSMALGRGIECWAIGGSSPEVWEAYQRQTPNSDLLIIGFSSYDLNEQRLCDSRANIIPLGQSLRDLGRLGAGWKDYRRILSQYPLVWARTLFPTAGKSDSVLVGLRRLAREITGSAPTQEEKGNATVLPSQAVLDFGASTEKLSDWPPDKTLRRLAQIRTEVDGIHRFDGIQQLAFHRMLEYAGKSGRIIVVVMPVAPSYAREFLTPDVLQRLEEALDQVNRIAPAAEIVRLDQLPALHSDEYFSDFIHLNGEGRRIATKAFLGRLSQGGRKP